MSIKNYFTFNAYLRNIRAVKELTELSSIVLKSNVDSKEFQESFMQVNYFLMQMKSLDKIEKGFILPLYCISFYYSIYFSLRAYLACKGVLLKEIDGHSPCINYINNINKNEPHFFGYPYNILYNGLEKKFINLPQGVKNREVPKLSWDKYVEKEMDGRYSQSDPACRRKYEEYKRRHYFTNFELEDIRFEGCGNLDTYLSFLRTTAEKKIKNHKEKNKNPITLKTATASVFDAFYRTRIRMNYKDLTPFVENSLRPDPETLTIFNEMCTNMWSISTSFARSLFLHKQTIGEKK